MNATEYIYVSEHAHAALPGGIFLGDTTAQAILWLGLWWPTPY